MTRQKKFALVVDRILDKAVDGRVTFTKRELRDLAGAAIADRVVIELERRGLLMYVRGRGRLGIEYRLLTEEQADARTYVCDTCGEREWRALAPMPDLLDVYFQEHFWGDFRGLLLCLHCYDEDPSATQCPGCGTEETHCHVNGRPVCARCFFSVLDPAVQESLVAGRTATLDLSPLADSFLYATAIS